MIRKTRADTDRLASAMSRIEPLLPYFGAALLIIGFGLIAVTWGRVAGLADVALQLPYIASGAFGGLGFIMCGIALLAATGARRDTRARQEKLTSLAQTLDEILVTLSAERHAVDPGQDGQ